MSGPASDLLQAACRARARCSRRTCRRPAKLVPAHVEMGLADLLAHGFVTCDSFAALRQMITPPSRRRSRAAAGRALVPLPHRRRRRTRRTRRDELTRAGRAAAAAAHRRRLPPDDRAREDPGHLVGADAHLPPDGASRRSPRRALRRRLLRRTIRAAARRSRSLRHLRREGAAQRRSPSPRPIR